MVPIAGVKNLSVRQKKNAETSDFSKRIRIAYAIDVRKIYIFHDRQ